MPCPWLLCVSGPVCQRRFLATHPLPSASSLAVGAGRMHSPSFGESLWDPFPSSGGGCVAEQGSVWCWALVSQWGVGMWAALACLGWCSCHLPSVPHFYFSSPPLLTPLFHSIPFPFSVTVLRISFPSRPRAPRDASSLLLSTTLKPKQEAQSCSFHFLPK